MALKRDKKVESNFNSITISLSSPEEILEKSHGEVLKPETRARWFILRANFWSCKRLRMPLW
jgi:hypothetical protein